MPVVVIVCCLFAVVDMCVCALSACCLLLHFVLCLRCVVCFGLLPFGCCRASSIVCLLLVLVVGY